MLACPTCYEEYGIVLEDCEDIDGKKS